MSSLKCLGVTGSVTVQDAGREGCRAMTVPLSGAADQRSWQFGNRLVGNVVGAASLECTFASLQVQASTDVVVAVTGATTRCVVVGNDSRPRRSGGMNVAFTVRAGDILHIDPPTDGLRSYVAVRGGFDVAPTLGSRSWDSLSQFGPPPVAKGVVLAIGDAADPSILPTIEQVALRPAPRDVLSFAAGPHLDLLGAPALRQLAASTFTVGQRCDRVGVQLDEVIVEGLSASLPSFAILPGSVQLPPDGRPFILGRDCGTSGGYPVVAVLRASSLDALGQVRPGDRFRFLLR